MTKTGIVYKITCKKTNKSYIGQTTMTLQKRMANHISRANKSGRKSIFHQVIQEYGRDKFEIAVLKECEVDELDFFEKKFIKILNTRYPDGYNKVRGGGRNGRSDIREVPPKLPSRKQISFKSGSKKSKIHSLNEWGVTDVEIKPISGTKVSAIRVLVGVLNTRDRYRIMFNGKISQKLFDKVKDFVDKLECDSITVHPDLQKYNDKYLGEIILEFIDDLDDDTDDDSISPEIQAKVDQYEGKTVSAIHFAVSTISRKFKTTGETKKFEIVRLLVETSDLESWKDKKPTYFGGSTMPIEEAHESAEIFAQCLQDSNTKKHTHYKTKSITETYKSRSATGGCLGG